MATTTNYGWTTPDDTALVKDGAAAIRSLGTSIDTTVFNNASAGIAKTIVDAKGDLIAATAADTVARLAVGTNDQVLIADSTTATGLKWGSPSAGGYTVIASGSIASSVTGLDLTSISASYTDLKLYITDLSLNSSAVGQTLEIRLNNDSGANYEFNRLTSAGTSVTATSDSNRFSVAGVPNDGVDNSLNFDIFNYSDTASRKTVTWQATMHLDSATGNTCGWGSWCATPAAVNRITLVTPAGAFDGGSYTLYGVK